VSGEPTIESVNSNISKLSEIMKSFISAQTVTNESNAKTLDKLSDVLSKSESMQTEINGISNRITEIVHDAQISNRDISDIKEGMAVNKSQLSQFQDIKKMFLSAMIGVFFMFLTTLAAQVYNSQNRDEQPKYQIKQNQPDKEPPTS